MQRNPLMASREVAGYARLLLGLALLLLLSAGAYGQTLRYLAVDYRPEFIAYLREEVIPAFEQQHGIEVSLETISSWDVRSERILLSIASGVPYDVVTTGFYSPYEESALGILAPLTDYVADWEHTESIPDAIWDALSWQGDVYVIPYNMGPRAIGYNKLRFAEAGLDPDQPPASWDELTQAARRVTRYDDGRVVQQGWNFTRNAAQEFMWFVHQAGLPPADMDQLKSNLDHPDALQALYAMREFFQAAGANTPTAGASFANGTLVMEWHNPTTMSQRLTATPALADDYGAFAPRRSPDSDPVAMTYIDGVGVLAQSQNKDLAFKLIDFMYQDEVLIEAYRRAGFLTARTDMMGAMSEVQEHIPIFYGMFPYARMAALPPPRDVSQGELRTLINQVIANNLSPEEALVRGHDLWSRLLTEWESVLAENR